MAPGRPRTPVTFDHADDRIEARGVGPRFALGGVAAIAAGSLPRRVIPVVQPALVTVRLGLGVLSALSRSGPDLDPACSGE